MADLPHITHLSDQAQSPANGIIHHSRWKKIQKRGRHLHQKPHHRKREFAEPEIKEKPPTATLPPPHTTQAQPEIVEIPQVLKIHQPRPSSYFSRENLEQPKSNPLQVIGQFLHKKPTPDVPKQPAKKVDAEELAPMSRRVYYGIMNALSDQKQRDEAHTLLAESLAAGNEADTLVLEGKRFKIKNITGPNFVDEHFIVNAKVTLEELDSLTESSLNLKEFINKLHSQPPIQQTHRETIAPEEEIEELPSVEDMSSKTSDLWDNPQQPEEEQQVTAAEPVWEPEQEEVNPSVEPPQEQQEEVTTAPNSPTQDVTILPEEPPLTPVSSIENSVTEISKPTDNDQLLSPSELTKVIEAIRKDAISEADYNELVAPFHNGNLSDHEIQTLLSDPRTQNATFLVYGHRQLNQLLTGLGLPEQEVEELITDTESKRTEWGIINPEYSLRFCQTVDGPRLYSLNIIENPNPTEKADL